jgi:hypothetical protein
MTEEIKFRNAPRTKETEARILLIREKCNKSFGSSYSRHECILVEFGAPKEKEFTIFVVPTRASILFQAISFRADQSGTIRAAKVNKPGVRCPEDG